MLTWRRAQMVLLSAQGMPVARTAEVSFTSDDRVRAVIHNVNTDGFDSLYPTYMDGLPIDASHAFGLFDRTLCGIQEAGTSPSDHWWLPERKNVCGACREAADVIDGCWSQAMRGENARVGVAR